jgi:phosphoglycolate phosphatase-like HAD superfamily hydrolase
MNARQTDTPEAPVGIALLIIDPEDVLFNGRPLRIRALAEALEEQVSSGKLEIPADARLNYSYLATRIEECIDSAPFLLQKEDRLRRLLLSVDSIHSHLIETETLETYPGVGEILQEAQGLGRELALYSHCSRDALLEIVERLQMESLFHFNSCTQDAGRHTTGGALPDILENLQFFPEECLLLSNNHLILNQARAMRICSAACGWGNPSGEAMALANFVADSPESLREVLRDNRSPEEGER